MIALSWSGPVFERPLAVAPGAVAEMHGFAQQELLRG